MTSRPAVGSQQPLQQRTAGWPPPSARTRPTQINAGGNITRGPGLTVDLSARVSQSSSQDSHTRAGGSGRASPVSSALGSPSRSQGSQRGGNIQGSSNGVSTPSANERLPSKFPPRPGQYTEQDFRERPTGVPNYVKADSKALSFDAPPAALIYPGGKSTGYNPWSGNHTEDSLTEQTVKSGFQNNKQPLIVNETNTARPSLWSHLKNKGGLQSLSQLFVSVLEKRQTSLRFNAPSTFRPPPRVTLTSSKREQWLTDLANPTYALRRLSKTIPYSINGKLLLESCASKNIPIARAVWLAKCVGSNELRMLKRKGAINTPGINPELKWVREWTVQVEQMAETVIDSTAEADWKQKMQYVMRFIFHLFAEQLLDHDHFLDWILAAFEGSNVERLPIWLVHIQLYWKFLVSHRKRGKRLAESLFRHLEAASVDNDSDLLETALQRMRILVLTLAVSHGGCMILPKVWAQYEHHLHAFSTVPQFAGSQAAIDSITLRNERASPVPRPLNHKITSPTGRVLEMLDRVGLDVHLDQTISFCLENLGSAQAAVPIVLRWASSIYREGAHRLYLATRILIRCKALGADIEHDVLIFITNMSKTSALDEAKVFRIVLELVRSGQFEIGRLLQNMIATGAIGSSEQDPVITQRLVRLVENIPTHNSPEHIANLRQILLQQAGLSNSDEVQAIEVLQDTISKLLQVPTTAFVQLDTDFASRLKSNTLSGRLILSEWVRQEVWELTRRNDSENLEGDQTSQEFRDDWTPELFIIARGILECLDDLPALADVIRICLHTSNMGTMASLIETVHFHLHSFAAIGALAPLWDQSLDRYQLLRNEGPLEKSFLQALISLSSKSGASGSVLQQLNYDLTRCEQRNTIAMCSPASDNAADMLTASPLDSDEEIERILSSGTTMDEHSMQRVFNRLVARIKEQTCFSLAKPSRCGQWFNHLRSFDDSTFDGLLRHWLTSPTFTTNSASYCQLLPALIGSECLSLKSFVQILDDHIQTLDAKDHTTRAGLEIGILQVLLSIPGTRPTASNTENYRYDLERRMFAAECPNTIVQHMRRLISAFPVIADLSLERDMRAVLLSPASLSLLRYVTVHTQLSLISKKQSTNIAPKADIMVEDIIDRLLDPSNCFNLDALGPHEQLAQLVGFTDDLSLPFCKLKIEYLMGSRSKSTAFSPHKDELARSLFQAVIKAGESDQFVWLELINDLDTEILIQIRRLAEATILMAVSGSIQVIRSQDPQSRGSVDQAKLRKSMSILGCTSSAVSGDTASEYGSAVNEKLRALADLVASFDMTRSSADEFTGAMAETEVCSCVHALLHLSLIHKSSNFSKSNPAEQISTLRTLCALLTQPYLENFPSTQEFIFDVAASFSDDLTDDLRARFLKTECQKYNDDPRLSFIFGPVPPTDGWVGFVTTNTSNPPPVAISRPNTPPARFGPGQQQQASARPQQRPAPPQRQATGLPNSQKNFNPPLPFPLRKWELIPDQGNNTSGNDTAISLGLFGARKVDSSL